MKKFRILLLTGMILGATAFAGCGKMAEDDINNKEVFSDDLEPLTEADTSDDDMEAIDEPSEDDAQEDTQDSAQDNKKNTDKNTEGKNTTNKNVN